MDYNVLFDNETVYGFITDIIDMFKIDIKDNPDDEVLKEGLAEAEKIRDEEDDRYLYRCELHPMGAFIFRRMVEAK